MKLVTNQVDKNMWFAADQEVCADVHSTVQRILGRHEGAWVVDIHRHLARRQLQEDLHAQRRKEHHDY